MLDYLLYIAGRFRNQQNQGLEPRYVLTIILNRMTRPIEMLYQLVVAASGSFDIILDDGRYKKIIELNRPNFGLLIVPGIWREIVNFSSGAICLVLASEKYNADDYIRDYVNFKEFKESLNAD